ncbi:hypothetical protein [Maribacter dokdonensis]|uniref:hypothetical protein n=1 Tax=Maribacter dokdonensis TaxID=320912 RepID=UPI002736A38F|nr:hypothetical protein [Maribacter dokdonensis]MDP2524869.1 hypothetical protein [Maribacter dokdonensis]
MKHTLEFKILKYLSENDNGNFVDIAQIESNVNLLKSVISDLKERKLILTEPYPSIPWDSSSVVIGSSPSDRPEKCKIKLSGKEYLESLKPQPIPKYQKIYLPLFILFGISTMLFAYLNYSSNNQNDFLNSKVDSLRTESLIYKDSVGQLKSQIELYKKQSTIDTIQTKN